MPQLGLTGLARIPLAVLQKTGDYGLDRGELLRQAGLSEAEISDPDSRVEVSKTWNLWRSVIERVDDHALGLHIGEAIEVRQFGLVGYAMYYSHSLAEGLHRLARYSHIISKALQFVFEPGPERARLAFEHLHPFDSTQHPADARLAAILKAVREITATPIVPVEVWFPYGRPENITEHQRFFAAPLKFEQERATLFLRTPDLQQPIVAADIALSGYLDRLAREVLQSIDNADSLTAKVRQALWTELSNGKPTIGKVARVLGVSTRTLQRRLGQEGSSFAGVLEEFRREMSVRLLRDRGLAVYEVAFLLGYSEPSTFFRAFRRWIGMAPQEYRKSLDDSSAGPGSVTAS